ncbi:Na-translocating system protein MpsC family protein [uncultured Clostridium sp.]|uniref:Na-translocating system protein MpsC family protein n=1 Tax=uncultured Clostridium sp. TaxID=59620 RepID=UPI0028E609E9|nr:Na-translocating system protein MpsC family protein [uncultured Clostridium sp.]
MCILGKEMNYIVESCISGIIKKSMGRGPEKTKVDIKEGNINIYIKGILSQIEKTALQKEKNYERVKFFRQGLTPILTKEIEEEISEILSKQVHITFNNENIHENYMEMVLKII